MQDAGVVRGSAELAAAAPRVRHRGRLPEPPHHWPPSSALQSRCAGTELHVPATLYVVYISMALPHQNTARCGRIISPVFPLQGAMYVTRRATIDFYNGRIRAVLLLTPTRMALLPQAFRSAAATPLVGRTAQTTTWAPSARRLGRAHPTASRRTGPRRQMQPAGRARRTACRWWARPRPCRGHRRASCTRAASLTSLTGSDRLSREHFGGLL